MEKIEGKDMKKALISVSKSVLVITLFGVALQTSAPLYAFNTQESIKTLKQETIKKLNENYSKLRKAVKCALTKDGCTDEQAFKIRATIGAILLALGITAAGTLLYFGRRAAKKKEKVEKVTTKVEKDPKEEEVVVEVPLFKKEKTEFIPATLTPATLSKDEIISKYQEGLKTRDVNSIVQGIGIATMTVGDITTIERGRYVNVKTIANRLKEGGAIFNSQAAANEAYALIVKYAAPAGFKNDFFNNNIILNEK